MESFLWKNVVKEIIRFENTIFDPFHGNFWFSIVHNSSTKPPFQSNQTTDAWRIYREKGFVLGLIRKDALLASYGRFKMPFCPLSLPNRTPIGARSYANWGTIGTQLAPNWHPIDHHSRLSGSIGEGQYYSTKLLIESIIQSNRGQVHVRTENVIFCTLFYILIWTKDRGKVHDRNLRAGWTHMKILMMCREFGIIESMVQHRSS